MRVFELQERISEVMQKIPEGEYSKELDNLFKEMLAKEITNQALMEAVSYNVSKEQVQTISNEVNKLIDEHMWRYIDANARKTLEDYGYQKPMVVVSEEEADEYLDKGENIFLLYKDGTESHTRDESRIKDFLLQGGLVAVSQFTIDKDLENILSGNNN